MLWSMQTSRAAWVSLEGATISFPLSGNVMVSRASAGGDVSQPRPSRSDSWRSRSQPKISRGERGTKRGAGKQARMKVRCMSLRHRDQWWAWCFRQATDLLPCWLADPAASQMWWLCFIPVRFGFESTLNEYALMLVPSNRYCLLWGFFTARHGHC